MQTQLHLVLSCSTVGMAFLMDAQRTRNMEFCCYSGVWNTRVTKKSKKIHFLQVSVKNAMPTLEHDLFHKTYIQNLNHATKTFLSFFLIKSNHRLHILWIVNNIIIFFITNFLFLYLISALLFLLYNNYNILVFLFTYLLIVMQLSFNYKIYHDIHFLNFFF